VPIGEDSYFPGRHFEDNILRLLRHFLTFSFFGFSGRFNGQTNGVTTGSPLCPVIADFYLEELRRWQSTGQNAPLFY
jgi:hypothetical protein